MLWLVRFMLAAAIAFAIPTPAPAAENAKVQASEQEGYGRLIFTFDDPPTIETQVSGGVVVISFSAPVDVKVESIARDLPSFVTVARRDPDGKGVRLALGRQAKVNTMAAGEKLFVDIMPESWVGMPPPLPPEVVADLTKRALDAERIKKELARAQTLPPAIMKVSSGSNADRMRLTFTFSDKVAVRFKSDRRYGILTVPGTTVFDAAMARAELPPEVTDFKAEVVGDALIVRFSVPEGKEMRGLPEDRAFVVDVTEPGRIEPAAEVAPSKEVPVPAGVPDKTAEVKASADKATKVAEVEGEFEPEYGEYAEYTEEMPRGYVMPKFDVAVKKTPEKKAEVATAERAAPAKAPPSVAPAAPVAAHAENQMSKLAALEPARPEAAPQTTPAATAPQKPVTASQPHKDIAAPENEAEPAMIPAAERMLRDLASEAEETGVRVLKDDTVLHVAFPLKKVQAAAAFIRGSSMFLVFDGDEKFDTRRIADNSGGLISRVQTQSTGAGVALELTLAQPRLASLTNRGRTWILSLGETILVRTRPIHFTPSFGADGRTLLEASVEGTGTVHHVKDNTVGDELYVVTLGAPTRGTVRERDFIEFSSLPTSHGLAFKPIADDFLVKTTQKGVMLTRDKGLTVSLDAAQPSLAQVELKPGSPFAPDAWRKAKMGKPEEAHELSRIAAGASPEERTKARVQLARFQLASGNAAETKAILEVAAKDSPGLADDPDVKLMRGSAFVMLRQFDEAARMLGSGSVSVNGEAALWLMIAQAGRGNIGLARDAYRRGEPVLDAMPPDLQRLFRQTMAEIAIAARDFATAATQIDALDTLGMAEGWAQREVMRGQIAEGFDQPGLALEAYRRAMDSDDEIAKAKARLHATNLRYQMNEIARTAAIKDLERLTSYWRGDKTEASALASLAMMYKGEQRWRDAFSAMRTAAQHHPKEESTRMLQDEMAVDFARLFLGEGGEIAPPTLESVALFYDFKELTPPGRKGDELIRKLADRLVEVDLLTQAADLLTYQVRNRLQGPAKAQVAAHVAAIELMDRKPGKALNVLHETRFAGLPADLVRSRLILEARALSELRRPDLALEMIAAYEGEEINRLRADIQWAAGRWQSAGEALEFMLGDTWREKEPLDTPTRQDVLRAAIAYALSEDSLGLDRLRSKFALKFAETPEAHTFDVVTAPSELRGPDFMQAAKAASVADTLKSFLEDYRERYPESAPPVVRMKEDGTQKTADARPT